MYSGGNDDSVVQKKQAIADAQLTLFLAMSCQGSWELPLVWPAIQAVTHDCSAFVVLILVLANAFYLTCHIGGKSFEYVRDERLHRIYFLWLHLIARCLWKCVCCCQKLSWDIQHLKLVPHQVDAVPGATSPRFFFLEVTPGAYDLCPYGKIIL